MGDIASIISLYLAAAVLILGLLAAASYIGIAKLEAAHPPAGRFLDVQGVRLHVVEIGLSRGAPGADPALVLIHGASGNLEDMRLALGERLASSHRVILIDRPGHGWSSRPIDDEYSPARQAELVTGALDQIGVQRAVMIGHSLGGVFATAFALAYPQRTAGLVLLSAVTHPWHGNPGWYNKLALLPGIGGLFLRAFVYPLGLLLVNRVSRSVFEPQQVPNDYVRRAGVLLVLRPRTFYSNARELAQLERFIAAQVPRYANLCTPTLIISGDRDRLVSPLINARALAAILPRARLLLLKDIGHMPHHAAPDIVAAAIDKLIAPNSYAPLRPTQVAA